MVGNYLGINRESRMSTAYSTTLCVRCLSIVVRLHLFLNSLETVKYE